MAEKILTYTTAINREEGSKFNFTASIWVSLLMMGVYAHFHSKDVRTSMDSMILSWVQVLYIAGLMGLAALVLVVVVVVVYKDVIFQLCATLGTKTWTHKGLGSTNTAIEELHLRLTRCVVSNVVATSLFYIILFYFFYFGPNRVISAETAEIGHFRPKFKLKKKGVKRCVSTQALNIKP